MKEPDQAGAFRFISEFLGKALVVGSLPSGMLAERLPHLLISLRINQSRQRSGNQFSSSNSQASLPTTYRVLGLRAVMAFSTTFTTALTGRAFRTDFSVSCRAFVSKRLYRAYRSGATWSLRSSAVCKHFSQIGVAMSPGSMRETEIFQGCNSIRSAS